MSRASSSLALYPMPQLCDPSKSQGGDAKLSKVYVPNLVFYMYHGLDRSRRLRFHAGVALPSTGSKPVVPNEVLAQSVVSSCCNIVNVHLRSIEQYHFPPFFFLSTSRSLSTRLFLVSTIIHTTHPIPFRLRHNFVKDATYHGLSHTPIKQYRQESNSPPHRLSRL